MGWTKFQPGNVQFLSTNVACRAIDAANAQEHTSLHGLAVTALIRLRVSRIHVAQI